jgi:tRNA (guanine37-N1)-methyltransferase
VKFSLLTIHPEILLPFSEAGLLGKAQKRNLIDIRIHNIRDFADPPHYRVDEKPYGGGPGMVMKVEPITRAVRAISDGPNLKKRIIVLSAKGKKFDQKIAHRFLSYDQLILICGRYEGIDERVYEHFADEEVRVGDYVLMGGEVAAAVIVEAVARLVPGVLGNPISVEQESFSSVMAREYAQYTRPPEFEGHLVPEVLLKGHHSEIEKWRTLKSSKASKADKGRK